MRIIAGTARGRPIEAPVGKSTRPTLDRVREAMFGMIQFDVPDSYVLDLFAGSGALGLEALSRGAEHAVFCDFDRATAALVSRNVAALGFSEKSEVYSLECFLLLDRLAAEGRKFSLVLLDPPYYEDLYEPVLAHLMDGNLLADGCIIMAEHPVKAPLRLEPGAITVDRTRRYGDIAVSKLIFSANNGGKAADNTGGADGEAQHEAQLNLERGRQ